MANNELQMPMAKKYKMPFKSITKRDGTLADFDSDKIYNAILRAGENTGEVGPKKAKTGISIPIFNLSIKFIILYSLWIFAQQMSTSST